jgi:hypothetical protein
MRKNQNLLAQLDQSNFDILNNDSLGMLKGGCKPPPPPSCGCKTKKSKKRGTKKSKKSNYGCGYYTNPCW